MKISPTYGRHCLGDRETGYMVRAAASDRPSAASQASKPIPVGDPTDIYTCITILAYCRVDSFGSTSRVISEVGEGVI